MTSEGSLYSDDERYSNRWMLALALPFLFIIVFVVVLSLPISMVSLKPISSVSGLAFPFGNLQVPVPQSQGHHFLRGLGDNLKSSVTSQNIYYDDDDWEEDDINIMDLHDGLNEDEIFYYEKQSFQEEAYLRGFPMTDGYRANEKHQYPYMDVSDCDHSDDMLQDFMSYSYQYGGPEDNVYYNAYYTSSQ